MSRLKHPEPAIHSFIKEVSVELFQKFPQVVGFMTKPRVVTNLEILSVAPTKKLKAATDSVELTRYHRERITKFF